MCDERRLSDENHVAAARTEAAGPAAARGPRALGVGLPACTAATAWVARAGALHSPAREGPARGVTRRLRLSVAASPEGNL